MATIEEIKEIDNEIDKKLKELDIVKTIKDKDVPYVIMQVRGLTK